MTREAEIDRIVADTGVGRLQAHYHIQGRDAARAALARRRRRIAIDAAIDVSGAFVVVDQAAFERGQADAASLIAPGVALPRAAGLRPIGEIIRPIIADIAERVK